MHIERTVDVDGDAAEVFSYLADFEHVAEWDPGVVSARRLTAGPTRLGSRFEVVTRFRGRTQRFLYDVRELEEGRRVALHGEGKRARSDDAVDVAAAGAGRSRVTYRAEIRLKGPFRLAEPFLRSILAKMGDDAVDGLVATLNMRAASGSA